MKFYLVEITKMVDKDKTEKAIYEYDSRKKAEAMFHKKIGGAMDNENFEYEMVTVLTDTGSVVLSKSYVNEDIPKVEEVVEETQE